MSKIKEAILAKMIEAENARADDGSVAAEYGLLIAGIAVLIGAAALLLGGRISDMFDSIL